MASHGYGRHDARLSGRGRLPCAVASHLLASVPNSTFVEAFHPTRDPIFWRMLGNRPELVDGMFSLPGGPGFGWQLDQSFIDEFRADAR